MEKLDTYAWAEIEVVSSPYMHIRLEDFAHCTHAEQFRLCLRDDVDAYVSHNYTLSIRNEESIVKQWKEKYGK